MRALQPDVLLWFRRMFHWNPEHILERYQVQPLAPDLLTVKRHALAVPSGARCCCCSDAGGDKTAPGFRGLRKSANVFPQIKKEIG